MQADSVTSTSAVPRHQRPSEVCTKAITSWDPFRRTRVATSALADQGPYSNSAITGRGLRLESNTTRRTWLRSLMGLSTRTLRGTDKPLSAKRGVTTLTRSGVGLLPPVKGPYNCAQSRLAGGAWARAGAAAQPTQASKPPKPWRRDQLSDEASDNAQTVVLQG